MHIPGSMLQGAVCPVTIGVGAASVVGALYFARKTENKPSAAKFAAVTSLVFALQMLNFPVQNGTSGHLLGAMLAVGLLGIPYAVIAMAVVLVVQGVFFADGGINALGANILNMGVVGVVFGGMLFQYLNKIRIPQYLALAFSSWISVVAASAACSLEVAWAGAVALDKALPAMVGVHALIGCGEAVLTVGVVALLTTYARVWNVQEKFFALATFGLAVVAAILSPFASSFPDGLEWVAENLSFTAFIEAPSLAMFPDYQLTAVSDPSLSVIGAGLVGIALVAAISWGLMKAAKASA